MCWIRPSGRTAAHEVLVGSTDLMLQIKREADSVELHRRANACIGVCDFEAQVAVGASTS
jgi:hypothetical protein